MSTTVAEVPMASPAWADPTNYKTASRSTYNRVVIHVTDGHGNALPVAQMWQQSPSTTKHTSAHFVVGQDGTILQCVRLKDIAWHAHDASLDSVGIEHCARAPKELGPTDAGLPVSDVQYADSAKLVAYLLKAAGLPANRTTVIGHCEVDTKTTHADCPNAIWDWSRYMDLVNKEMAV